MELISVNDRLPENKLEKYLVRKSNSEHKNEDEK